MITSPLKGTPLDKIGHGIVGLIKVPNVGGRVVEGGVVLGVEIKGHMTPGQVGARQRANFVSVRSSHHIVPELVGRRIADRPHPTYR